MRVLCVVALVATFFTTTVIAESAPAQLAAILPTCAVWNTSPPFDVKYRNWYLLKLECMASSMMHTSCAATDQACLCMDTNYSAILEKCVMTSCTIRQSLSKSTLQSQLIINTDNYSNEKCNRNCMRCPYSRSNKYCLLCWSYRRCNCSHCRYSSYGSPIKGLRWHVWLGWLDHDVDNGNMWISFCLTVKIMLTLCSAWLFHFRHSLVSVCDPWYLRKAFIFLIIMHSGQHRLRERHMDAPFRKHHPYPIRQ